MEKTQASEWRRAANVTVKCVGRVMRCQREGRSVSAVGDEYRFERS